MPRSTGRGIAVERLTADLVGTIDRHPLADELQTWLAGSARFRSFAETYRDKIRKKLRTTNIEALRGVRCELQVARLFLTDRRLDVAFEAYGAGKVGPDLTVTRAGGQSFNVEVTRLRRAPVASAAEGPIVAKLRQLPPSAPNVLLIAIEGETAAALDVAATARALRNRADAKDEAFFARRGFDGSRGFYERFLRLAAVLVWCEAAVGDGRVALWINRSARIALPDRAARTCVQCLRTES